MKIQILGTGCPKCKKLTENVQKAIEELGLNHQIEKIDKIDEIINMGVMITPAIAIDGNVKSSGKLLSVEEIKSIIK
jgi:small redox-active disulfide protein 2